MNARLLLLGLVCSCSAIKDATYPDYYEVRFADGSKAKGPWFCDRQSRAITGAPEAVGNHTRADVLECSNVQPLFETLTGTRRQGGDL